jgi:hypothetical protein
MRLPKTGVFPQISQILAIEDSSNNAERGWIVTARPIRRNRRPLRNCRFRVIDSFI